MEHPEKEMQQPPWTDQPPPRVVEAKTSIISALGADELGSDNTCSVTEARDTHITMSPTGGFTPYFQIQSGFDSYDNLIMSAGEQVLLMRKPQPRSSAQDFPQGQRQGHLCSLPRPTLNWHEKDFTKFITQFLLELIKQSPPRPLVKLA